MLRNSFHVGSKGYNIESSIEHVLSLNVVAPPKIVGLISVGIAVIVGIGAFAFLVKPPPAILVSDRALIDKAENTQEVQAFLNKYPGTTPNVYRDEYLAVVYSIAKHEIPGQLFTDEEFGRNLPRAQLSVLLDNDIQVQSVEFTCSQIEASGSFVLHTAISEYLRNQEHCWDDPSPPRLEESLNDSLVD